MPNAEPHFHPLLTYLLQRLDLPDNAGDVAHSAEEPAVGTGTWSEQVLKHVEPLGIDCRIVDLTVPAAVPYAGFGCSLVTRTEGAGADEWIALEGKRGSRIAVVRISSRGTERQRLRLGELQRSLNAGSDHRLRWAAMQAMAPLQNAISTHDNALTPFQRLRKLLRDDRNEIVLTIIFAIGVGILSLATPVAVQALVNTFALGGLLQPLIVLSILLFAFLAFGGALRVLQTYVVEVIQRRIFVRVLSDLAFRLPRLRPEILEKSHGTELVNRFFDVLTVQKVSAILLLDGIAVSLQTIIGLIVLAFYHPLLLAFDLMLVGAILFVIFVLGRGAQDTAIAESKAKYAAAGWLEELARNPFAFKLHGGSDLALTKADQRAFDYLRTRSAHFRIVLRQSIGSVVLQVVAGTAMLGVGGDLVIRGQLTLGQLVAAELIVSIVLASFSKIGKQLENFYDLLAAVDKLGHVIDLPLERSTGVMVSPGPAPARLDVHALAFAYKDGRPVFTGLSFQVLPGERVGVVGRHGTGKSTLADLLFGLRSPTAGRIELNGIDIRDLRLESLRRYVAVVKDSEIIEDTVIENVRIGRTDLSTVAIRHALEQVGLLDEILALPDGLQTVLGHAGTPLSFGQTERLMLARAVVGSPMLLVIDGMLDAMDPVLKAQICNYLFDPAAPWTLLITSLHADNYMQRCSRLITLPGKGVTASAPSA